MRCFFLFCHDCCLFPLVSWQASIKTYILLPILHLYLFSLFFTHCRRTTLIHKALCQLHSEWTAGFRHLFFPSPIYIRITRYILYTELHAPLFSSRESCHCGNRWVVLGESPLLLGSRLNIDLFWNRPLAQVQREPVLQIGAQSGHFTKVSNTWILFLYDTAEHKAAEGNAMFMFNWAPLYRWKHSEAQCYCTDL